MFAQCAGQAYAQIGYPQLNAANIWEVYRKLILTLQNISSSNGTNANQDCIDAVDEWQVNESLQDSDLNGEPDIPYPLIEGHELVGGIEQEDGSLYLGGVNEGRGLGMWMLYLLSIYDLNLINVLQDPDLEGRLDKMEELDEFEPDEVNGGLVFSEDEEDMVNPDDKDDW